MEKEAKLVSIPNEMLSGLTRCEHAERLVWTRFTSNASSPYPEDRRTRYTCMLFGFEITKEGDGKYWLRHNGNPVGLGPRLADAKRAALQLVIEGKAVACM